jgi:hypothetical protein
VEGHTDTVHLLLDRGAKTYIPNVVSNSILAKHCLVISVIIAANWSLMQTALYLIMRLCFISLRLITNYVI